MKRSQVDNWVFLDYRFFFNFFSCLKKPTIHSVSLHEIPIRNSTCITKLSFLYMYNLNFLMSHKNQLLVIAILVNFWDAFLIHISFFYFCLQYVKEICDCTYEISPNTLKASFSCEVSISGLRSPTNMWKCSTRDN